MGERSDWLELFGLHRLDDTSAVAERLAADYECTSPAGGLGPGTHCAACCYGTGIAASSMEEFETAKVLLAVPILVEEIKRLREPQVYVDEGWWHPNVKGGQVHDHGPNVIQSMHRLCEPVYTRRSVNDGD